MVSKLYKESRGWQGELAKAYKERALYIHKDGTVEFVQYYPYTDEYAVRCYGINKYGVHFEGSVIEQGPSAGKFYFTISTNEHIVNYVAQLLEIDAIDELTSYLYND